VSAMMRVFDLSKRGKSEIHGRTRARRKAAGARERWHESGPGSGAALAQGSFSDIYHL
jgi:hypothetical protein